MAAARDLVIGLDSSTTACKAIVWDRTGNPLAVGRAAQPLLKPRPGWHEQPAEAWWQAAQQALREAAAQVDPARLAAISISAQRETFVVTGADGQPLGNAMVWMDERCRELLPELDRIYGQERTHQESGKPLSANLTTGKLFWLRERAPETFASIARVMDVHAFLAHRLTGRCVTSWGCADPTGLFDMRHNRWNAALIEAIGLRVKQFPEAVPGGTVIGRILPQAARACGLPEGLPLVAGLGDGQAAGLGVNVTHPREAYLNLGTAVVSGAVSEQYRVDRAFRTMYGGAPGTFVYETVLLGGAYTITWFVENFFERFTGAGSTPKGSATAAAGQPEAVLEAAAATIPPGAEGLVAVPYWNSAMNPYWDASASGIVVGWRGIHGRAHLYRAILEGIALELRLHAEGVESALGGKIERWIAVGGGSRSTLWRQIIADATGRAVFAVEAPEASALGAGMLAAAGAGLFPNVREAARAMARPPAQPLRPDPQRAEFYARLFETVYRRLYPALQSPLTALANLSEE